MKKGGMSDVVTTLLIILLVVVAVGIIWVVIRNVFQKGSAQVELSQKCKEVDLTLKKLTVSATDTDTYTVVITRTGGEERGGVKFTLNNGDDYSDLTNFSDSAFSPLETHSDDFADTGVTGATQIEMTFYFFSDTGKEQLCPNPIIQEL